jgi:4-hydroxy-2-oxoglutarate aldolase
MRLTGVFPPLTTPFDSAGRIDEAGLKSNVARYARTALTGVVALGSNGEAPFVDEAESVRIVEVIRGELPPTKILIAGAGRESTQATIDAARRAASAGADAVLVRPPCYYKSRMTADVLVAHFSKVADECPVPVVLYNVPAFTGLDLPVTAVERLSRHPNIVGVKESAGDVDRIADDVARVQQDFEVLCGSMPVFYPSLRAGAVGGVVALACALPDECVELFELFSSGRQDEAAELQQSLTLLSKLVTAVHGVPGLKAALDLAGFVGGLPRAPLASAPREAKDEIAAAFAAAAPARSRASS